MSSNKASSTGDPPVEERLPNRPQRDGDAPRAFAPLTRLRTIGNAALFGCFLCCLFAAESHFSPYPRPKLHEDKFEYFKLHKDEYDVVFLGSSLIHLQVNPRVFDKALTEKGHKIKSFNLAVMGYIGYDISASAKLIMDLHPARLKYLVTDPRSYSPVVNEPFTQPATWYHDLPTTVMALKQIPKYVPRNMGLIGKAMACEEMFRICLQHMFMYYSNLGMGMTIINNMMLTKLAREQDLQSLDKTQGYAINDRNLDVSAKEIFLRNVEWFRQNKDLPKNVADDVEFPDAVPLTDLVAQTRAQGVDLVVLLTPCVDLQLYRWGMDVRQIVPYFLNFADCDRYPQFFTVDVRADMMHLNAKGSEVLSEVLAQEFLPILSKRGL